MYATRLALAATLLVSSGTTLASDDNFRLSNMASPDDYWSIPVPSQQQYLFDSFARDLGSLLSYKYSFPAATTGLYGFDVGMDLVMASIDTDPECPSSEEVPTGACTGDNRQAWSAWSVIDADHRLTLGKLYAMPGLRVRKGLPWSLEVGSSLYALPFSSQAAVQGYGRWAFHEGFDHGTLRAIPDAALTLAGTRLVGNPELDLGVFDWGMTFGWTFPIGGVMASHTGDFSFFGGFGKSIITAVPDEDLPDSMVCLKGRTGRITDQVGSESECTYDDGSGDPSRAVLYDSSFAPWKGSFGVRVYNGPFHLGVSGEAVQKGVGSLNMRMGFFF